MEPSNIFDRDAFLTQLNKLISAFEQKLTIFRTGRAHSGLIKDVLVTYYDQPTPLWQLATIKVVDGTTITINPYDPQAGPAITKAILTANLNLNPTAQDHGILIKVPPLTLASKQIIIKKINLTTEQFLGQTRYLRKRMLTKLRSLELSSDELHHYTEQVNQLAKNTHQKIHALAQSKIIFLKK